MITSGLGTMIAIGSLAVIFLVIRLIRGPLPPRPTLTRKDVQYLKYVADLMTTTQGFIYIAPKVHDVAVRAEETLDILGVPVSSSEEVK